jgi:signal transduction histidine kinase
MGGAGSGAFARGVLESLRDHVAVIDSAGRIIAVNEAWRNFALENDAASHEAVMEGADYLDVCQRAIADGDEFAEQALAGLRSMLRGEAGTFAMEYPCSSPTEERWYLMRVVPLRLPEGGCVVSHTKITEWKEAERNLRESERALRRSREEYRSLARKLLSAHEDARRELARELHDDLSQRLAVLSIEAERLANEGSTPPAIVRGLRNMHHQMGTLSGDIHAIARQLHPSILDDLGLDDAVAAACSTFSEQEGVPVDYRSEDLPDSLEPDVALNMYRIIQEALNNIAKHSRATEVHISMVGKNDAIHLSIRDNGSGFERSDLRRIQGLGLASMRERVDLINGALTIKSSPGRGTGIRVVAPYSARQSGT